jgi:hypothetical protein
VKGASSCRVWRLRLAFPSQGKDGAGPQKSKCCRGGNKRRLLGGTKGDSRSASRKGSNSRPLGQALRRPERSGGRRKAWPSGREPGAIAP